MLTCLTQAIVSYGGDPSEGETRWETKYSLLMIALTLAR